MAWKKLFEKLSGEFEEEIARIRADAEEEAKKILESAKKEAENAINRQKEEASRQAETVRQEIVATAKIKAGQIERAARADSINEIYREFLDKVKADRKLSSEIIGKFLEENVRPGDLVKIQPEVSQIISAKKLRSAKLKEDPSCGFPVEISRGKIRIVFDWDEFLSEFKERTLKEVSQALKE